MQNPLGSRVRILLLLLFSLVCNTLLAQENLATRLDNLFARNSELNSRIQVALCVYDLTADSMLYARGERQTMRPASNMKLITAIAALDFLGSDYNFTLKYSLDTARIDSLGVLHDRLYIRGGMNPMISRDDLERIAERVARLGVKEIRHGFCYDNSFKDSKHWGEGWCWDDDSETNPELVPLLYKGTGSFDDALFLAMSHHNVKVIGRSTQGAAPSSANTGFWLATPVSEVLIPMMKQSDNLMAESLFYQMAYREGGNYSGRKEASRVIERLVSRIGLNPDDYYFADGSGVSLYNYASPQLLVSLLKYAYKNKKIYNTLLPSLPKAGEDGTLAKRMNNSSCVGRIQAKTGTVTGASTLSGYATTANGHRLCFSIMCQGQQKAKIARDFQDQICAELVRPQQPAHDILY